MDNLVKTINGVRYVNDPREVELNPRRAHYPIPSFHFAVGSSRVAVDVVIAHHIGFYESIIIEQLFRDYEHRFPRMDEMDEIERSELEPFGLECLFGLTCHELFEVVKHLAELGLVTSDSESVYESENFWLKLKPVPERFDEIVKEAGYDDK